MSHQCKILIAGAGVTGLGAAWRLTELGKCLPEDWLLVEAQHQAGGLASSVIDSLGFTWDRGGHVIFSHYDYFDRLLDDLLRDKWVEHIREAWVWMRHRFIPYPLQNNIWRLPEEDLLKCLEGLLEVSRGSNGKANAIGQQRPVTFLDWIIESFGNGLAETFFIPYNRKVWAYDPSLLSVGWVGERVATVDIMRILQCLVWKKDDLGWGPNARFRFPLYGGTGSIWNALATRLPQQSVLYDTKIKAINSKEHKAVLSDGTIVFYDHLISTVPLDFLLRLITDLPTVSHLASHFRHSSTHVIGVGMEGSVPDSLKTKCWMYFPEPEVPFYRATVFSNYSPYNVPKPGKQWSLMCEVSESPDKPVVQESIVESVIEGAKFAKLIDNSSKIISRWHTRLEYGYPTPFLGRDALLVEIEPLLRKANIFSRGRFGAWKYEVSNQDHSFMQGLEAVDHILFGEAEHTYLNPGQVNAGKKVGVRSIPGR